MLSDGKLRGCELRATSCGGRQGLFATKVLLPETPVATETGLLFTESLHEKVVVKASEDPLVGIQSNFIPSEVLQGLVGPEEWAVFANAHRAQGDRLDGFVADSRELGGESQFIVDPAWISAESNSEPAEHEASANRQICAQIVQLLDARSLHLSLLRRGRLIVPRSAHGERLVSRVAHHMGRDI